eukprot:5134563-Ditylum_brightwellii.AAC.1
MDSSLLTAAVIQGTAEAKKDAGSEQIKNNQEDTENQMPVYNLSFDLCTYLVGGVMDAISLFSSVALGQPTWDKPEKAEGEKFDLSGCLLSVIFSVFEDNKTPCVYIHYFVGMDKKEFTQNKTI